MNHRLVVDASFMLSDLLPDENNIETDLAAHELHVPALFYLECTNVLNVALNLKKIGKDDFQAYLQIFQQLPLNVDKFCASVESLYIINKLSQAFALTTYDAAYLELAIRLDAKLATCDQKLKSAGIKSKIKTI